jgi:peptide deformylase
LKEQRMQVLINPGIKKRSNKVLAGREGCWSCGNICGNVQRALNVIVDALDRDNHHIQLELTGFSARIAQHEIDHLDGIRFPDRIPEDQPEKLHWVTPEEFEAYRAQWQTWPHLCPRSKWLDMKFNRETPRH